MGSRVVIPVRSQHVGCRICKARSLLPLLHPEQTMGKAIRHGIPEDPLPEEGVIDLLIAYAVRENPAGVQSLHDPVKAAGWNREARPMSVEVLDT